MSYDPAIPLSSDSPSVFPAQSQGNFTQLKKIIEADHQFNLTAAANDGYHNLIHMTQQSPSTTPIAVTGRLYSKLSDSGFMELFFMDDTPVTSKNYQITPTMPIRAAVNFTFSTPPDTLTIQKSYNVTTVVRNDVGTYTITFDTPMPDVNYIVHISGMPIVLGQFTFGTIAAVTTTTLLVRFFAGNPGPSGTSFLRDPSRAYVTVFSTT